ncbi:MAG: hypothetical protein ACXVPQ_01815 [Bacteroidia bacterium]
MEDETPLISALFEKAERYTRTSAELFKLKAIDKSAEMLSALAAKLVVLIAGVLFFLIFNIGVALWIGRRLGESYYGFFSVAGFYGLAGIVLYLFRDALIGMPVRNSIISQALK